MTARTIPGTPSSDARPSRSSGRRLLRLAWFPLTIVLVLVAGFFLLGPPSSGNDAALRARLAPGFGWNDPDAAPADASATELEIAEQYAIVRDFPDTVRAYVALGDAYLLRVRETGDASDYDRAEAAYESALRRAPDDVDALIGKAALALARHDFADALAIGERARELAPRTARVLGVIVDAQTELGRYDEALASAQAMLDLRPDVSSWSRVSYQRELHGDLPGAIEAMERAFSAIAGTTGGDRESIRVFAGDLRFRQGDLDRAEGAYGAALAALPGFTPAEVGMARVEAARGELDDAIERLAAVVERTPLPEHVVLLGELQEADGRTEDAARSYELARAIGTLFAANGVDVDLDLALFEADHGTDPGAAVDQARRAYEATPNVKAADALAWALHRAGQHEEAQRYADEALRLGTPYGSFRYHAGMIALANGDTDRARELLESALRDDPHFSPLHAPRAKAALEQLGG